MDKKNTLLGLILLGAAFALFFWQAQQMKEYEETLRSQQIQERELEEAEREKDGILPDSERENEGPGDAGPRTPEVLTGVPSGDSGAPALDLESDPPEVQSRQEVILENAFIRVTFSNIGGGIEKVEFLRTDSDKGVDPFVYNEGDQLASHTLEFPGSDGSLIPFLPAFTIREQTDTRITFSYRDSTGIEFLRTYRLADQSTERDPYVIEHEMMVTNHSGEFRELPTTFLRMGTTRSLAFDRMSVGEYLNVSYYDGNKLKYVKGRKFIGSNGFFGFWSREPQPNFREMLSVDSIEWASIKNQFFVGILKESGDGNSTARVSKLLVKAAPLGDTTSTAWRMIGISGSVGYDLDPLPAGQSARLGTEFYVGPKEYIRLQDLGNSEEKLMQYWGPDFISQGMTLLMHGIHKLVPSWGLSIFFLTLCIKLFFWPFTSRGMRAQKLNAVKMAPLQGEMKQLNVKYKDNPQARQKAMVDLYRKHDVNPAAMMGGCLPMLIQIPIFIGLYGMLRVAPEFRFAPLLWIESLAYPDTVAMIGGFPLNLLPLIYGAVVYFQMRMTPMPETADDTQQMTFKMMRFMPLLLVVWLYNFAAALFVYFTTNALLTMLQQFLINRKLQPEIDALKAEVEQKQSDGGHAAVGPAPWEKKAKSKAREKKDPGGKPAYDGLGATRRLKKSGGSSRRKKKK